MTLQPLRAAAWRRCAAAFVLAALVVFHVGATAAAQHVHGEEGEHCSICGVSGVDDACALTPTSPPRPAASAVLVGDLDQRNRRTSLHAYRARAPPLSH